MTVTSNRQARTAHSLHDLKNLVKEDQQFETRRQPQPKGNKQRQYQPSNRGPLASTDLGVESVSPAKAPQGQGNVKSSPQSNRNQKESTVNTSTANPGTPFATTAAAAAAGAFADQGGAPQGNGNQPEGLTGDEQRMVQAFMETMQRELQSAMQQSLVDFKSHMDSQLTGQLEDYKSVKLDIVGMKEDHKKLDTRIGTIEAQLKALPSGTIPAVTTFDKINGYVKDAGAYAGAALGLAFVARVGINLYNGEDAI